MKRLIIIAFAALMCTACLKSEADFLFREYGMGFVQTDGTILSDSEITYTVTENLSGVDYSKATRILFTMDAMSKISDDKYNGRLLQCLGVLYKDPVKLADIADPTTLGSDPVRITDAWISGGCLNLEFCLYVKKNSEVKHFLNLVCDETLTKEDGTLDLRFTHNAYEDKYDELNPDPDLALACSYVSFPLKNFCDKDGKIKASLRWKWDEEEDHIDFSTTIK